MVIFLESRTDITLGKHIWTSLIYDLNSSSNCVGGVGPRSTVRQIQKWFHFLGSRAEIIIAKLILAGLSKILT